LARRASALATVLADGKLYGRGGADDGYAVFASLAAIGALAGARHCAFAVRRLDRDVRGERQLRSARVLELLAPRMGAVDFVVGLDSGCGDYERLWATTSLRGLVGGTLTVDVLTEGVHSGDASGVVPSSFRIARACSTASRTAQRAVLPADLPCADPRERVRQAKDAAAIMGETTCPEISVRDAPSRWSPSTRSAAQPDVASRAVGDRRRWIAAIADAGNVLRPRPSLKLSLRLPPSVDGPPAQEAMRTLLEAIHRTAQACASKATKPQRVECAADRAVARTGARESVGGFYGKPPAAMGEGGTIPVHGDAGQAFSQTPSS
jgi:acetylornithine deacetylase/succinyl-diaminopimelate desuccinylase-like protein